MQPDSSEVSPSP